MKIAEMINKKPLDLVVGKFYKSNHFDPPRFYRYKGNLIGKSWVADVFNCSENKHETIDSGILDQEVHPSEMSWGLAYPDFKIRMQKMTEYVPIAFEKAEGMRLL